MKKIAVFPFDIKNVYYLLYSERISSKGEIRSLIYLKGFELNDRYKEYKLKFKGYLGDDVKEGLDKIDIVYISDIFKLSNELKVIYADVIRYALFNKIKVFINQKLAIELYDNLTKDEIRGLSILMNEEPEENLQDIKYRKVFNLPVLSVMSICEDTENLETSFCIRNFFQKQGYNILHFSSNADSQMFDCELFPDFLSADNISLKNKILKFNQCIFQKIQREKYDLILVSIEEPIIGLNKFKMYNYAESAYVISNALEIEENILCLNFMSNINSEFLQEISNACKYKFNAPTNYFWLSGNLISYSEEKQNKIEKVYLSKEFITKNFPVECEEKIFNSIYSIGDLSIPNKIMESMQAEFDII